MNRFQAFGIHLGISLLIFAVLGFMLVFWWYPDFFFLSDGGWQGVRILALVDLVLGPCLTLVVYKHGKPGLSRDLTMIGLFQAACLAAGTWVVYNERPIAMIYSDDRFFSVSADDYTANGLAVPDATGGFASGPTWLSVRLPDDLDAIGEIRGAALRAKTPLHLVEANYQPFDKTHIDLDGAQDPADVQQRAEPYGALTEWLTTHGGNVDDYAFFPFSARYAFVYVGVRKSDQTAVGMLNAPAPL